MPQVGFELKRAKTFHALGQSDRQIIVGSVVYFPFRVSLFCINCR
jgi:hypothetical protein